MSRDEDLIMRNVRRLIKKQPENWVLYKEVFGTGSGIAFKRCRELGLDPESKSSDKSLSPCQENKGQTESSNLE